MENTILTNKEKTQTSNFTKIRISKIKLNIEKGRYDKTSVD